MTPLRTLEFRHWYQITLSDVYAIRSLQKKLAVPCFNVNLQFSNFYDVYGSHIMQEDSRKGERV